VTAPISTSPAEPRALPPSHAITRLGSRAPHARNRPIANRLGTKPGYSVTQKSYPPSAEGLQVRRPFFAVFFAGSRLSPLIVRALALLPRCAPHARAASAVG
jgi:hypothetical protein